MHGVGRRRQKRAAVPGRHSRRGRCALQLPAGLAGRCAATRAASGFQTFLGFLRLALQFWPAPYAIEGKSTFVWTRARRVDARNVPKRKLRRAKELANLKFAAAWQGGEPNRARTGVVLAAPWRRRTCPVQREEAVKLWRRRVVFACWFLLCGGIARAQAVTAHGISFDFANLEAPIAGVAADEAVVFVGEPLSPGVVVLSRLNGQAARRAFATVPFS
jgi:hypothetical protein